MRSFQAVTTFSVAGYALYGNRMLDTFLRFWATDVPLSTYDDERLPAWFQAFKDRHAHNQRSNGRMRRYDFRFDAVKFGHKTAAIIDAATTTKADVLIWLDGDIATHAPVTLDLLESLLSEHKAIAWLDRDGSYPETGFVMFNLRHPGIPGLMKVWRELYETDRLFALPQWHDAFVLQRITSGLPWHSLSGAARATSHPLARGPLADYFDHRKGARKSLDHSPEHRVLA